MFITLYNISISLYVFLINIASFFNPKAKLWVEGRKDWKNKWKNAFNNSNDKLLWFHCASLGEFEQGRPLIEYYKINNPDYKILLTFFSPSGFEVRKNYPSADYILYLPADTTKNVDFILNTINPKALFIVKYEFWYHLINAAIEKKIPIYSVSAIFRKNHFIFKNYSKKYQELLKKMDKIFVQDADSKTRLQQIGIESVVSGDTRFDRVLQNASQKNEITFVKRFKSKSKLLVIGSAWKEDIDILATTINNLYLNKLSIGEIKVVIAPHEINDENINYIKKKISKNILLYSQAQNRDLSLFEVMVIDNIGMLMSIYAYADFVYVGGAFGKGLHNTLEPAVFGMPLFFGKNYHKFREAIDLVSLGGAIAIENAKEFELNFNQVAGDENFKLQMGEINKNFVAHNAGATQIITQNIDLK